MDYKLLRDFYKYLHYVSSQVAEIGVPAELIETVRDGQIKALMTRNAIFEFNMKRRIKCDYGHPRTEYNVSESIASATIDFLRLYVTFTPRKFRLNYVGNILLII